MFTIGDDLGFLLCNELVDHVPGPLVIDIFVGRYRSGDHCFAQTPGSLDDRQRFSRHRMGSEHHPCLLRVDHLLDNHSDVDTPVIKTLFCTVVNCPRSIQRSPTLLDSIKEVLLTFDIQVGLLLAGETCIGKVLCCRT